MENILAKDNFFARGLNENGRRECKFYTILSIVLFVVNAFTFWEFIYEFSNMVGSIVSGTPLAAINELKRMLPLELTAFVEIYLFMYALAAYRAGDEQKRIKIWRLNGNITVVLGAFIAIYTIVGLICGQYAALIEGFVSRLFPLDVLVGGLLIVIYGILAISYARRLQGRHTSLPFSNCLRPRGRRRASVNGWMVYSYMASLCGFAACIYSTFVMDFSHGNIFYNIMLWLNYFTAFAMFAVYRFVYAELKDEKKQAASHRFGLIFLIVNIILFALYMLAVQIENEAPNLNAFGVLPVDFTASFNAFAVLYGSNNILAPIAACLRREKKNK